MWKKIILGAVALILMAGVVGYAKRMDILLYIVANRDRPEVHPNRPVTWERGPEKTEVLPADKPNIILILLDDVGINDLSGFGEGIIETPNIARLAAQGVVFTNAYAGHANCAPSRAAILTGRDAASTGYDTTPTPDGMGRMIAAIGNYNPMGRPEYLYDRAADDANPTYNSRGLPGAEITMAETLREAGYHTMHIGKWHLGRERGMLPKDQGFDEDLMFASGLFLPVDDPNVVNAELPFSSIDKFLWARLQYAVMQDGGDWFAPKGYLTDYFTDHAVRAIEANAGRPFFLYLAHWGAHVPLQATIEDFEAVGDIQPHRRRVYAAMMRSLDRSVGRVMEALEVEGIADNTIVVLSSDNGAPDYIGIDGVNAPYRGWKNTFFEGGLRVPLSMTWPGTIASGTKIGAPVTHLDLMPTLVAAGGAVLPDDRTINGRDMAPLWADADRLTRPDDAIHWGTSDYRVVQAGGWKLQINPGSEQTWLFNLNSDPTEQTNLVEVEPEKVAELRALIEAHWAGAEPQAQSVVSGPLAIDKHLAEEMVEGDALIYWPN
ncbi:sulfatase-like hydrolase/transferase [Planktomarina temperata]|nr:sulfatase-like hydrolase/transferase [Planktomarina temperata]